MTGKDDLPEKMRDQYARIASEGDSSTRSSAFPSDPVEYAKSIGYSKRDIESVPEGTVIGLGCRNPIGLADLKEGEVVLDLGCGGGFDAFLAAQRVGGTGRVIGVDMTPQMVEKARSSAARGQYANVEFKAGVMEHLPVEDNSIDAVISNCVINHSPDKLTVFRELYRVLKPGGRIAVSDLVVQGEFQEAVLESLDAMWRDWIAGAAAKEEYLSAIASARFRDIAVVFEREFGMSPMDERLKGKIIGLQVKARK